MRKYEKAANAKNERAERSHGRKADGCGGCHLEVTEIQAAEDPVLQEAGVRRPLCGDIDLFVRPDGSYAIEWREIDGGNDAPIITFEIEKSQAAHLLLRFWIPEPFVDLFSSSLRLLRTQDARDVIKEAGLDAPPGPIRRALDVVNRWLEEETRDAGEIAQEFHVVQ